MPVLDARSLLALPGGDNSTDTVIAGVHFNKTILEYWNYTLYSNQTLSNGSWCLLMFEPYQPALLYPNGTFLNATWCFTPLNPIGPRAGTGIGFAVAYAFALMLILVCLRKHGKLYLPAQVRFRPIGRRWQWYWGIWVCACAFISLFTNVDVDRYYVQELPIILSCFFWFLLQWGATALVWEAVRHWGSWKERQFIDPNPFLLRDDDKRAKFEFFAPLWFYFWLWLNFFLIVPRNWEPLQLQRSPDQTIVQAVPVATDGRFKAAAFVLFVCWATTVVHLFHSITHYNHHAPGIVRRSFGYIRQVPLRFFFILPLGLAVVAYQALVSFDFSVSVLNVKGDVWAIYVGGYGPSLLILFVQVVWGFLTPNEDRELLRQRRARGEQIDRDLGIVSKPAWWRRVNGDHVTSMRERIARNVREIGGGKATARGVEQNIEVQTREAERAAAASGGIEMRPLRKMETSQTLTPTMTAAASRPMATPYTGRSDRRRSERTMQTAASLLFPNATPQTDRRAELMLDGPPTPPPPPYADVESSPRGRTLEIPDENRLEEPRRPGTSERSNSSNTLVSLSGRPQQVRSMLDI